MASAKSRGSRSTKPLDNDPINGDPLSFRFIKSKKSQPPNANIVKSFNPKSAQENGDPAWKTPYSHMAPGTKGIKEMTVNQKRGIAKILVARVIQPTVETR
jgi:hypothetical protein